MFKTNQNLVKCFTLFVVAIFATSCYAESESFDQHRGFTVTNKNYSQSFTFALKKLDNGEMEVLSRIDATPHIAELSERRNLSSNSQVTTIDLTRPWKNGPSSIKGKLTFVKTGENSGHVRFDGKLLVVNVGELEINEPILSF